MAGAGEQERCATGVLMELRHRREAEGIAETRSSCRNAGRVNQPVLRTSQHLNLISGRVSIRHGLKDPNRDVTACSTGAHAIGDAAQLIIFGDAVS